VAEDGLQVRSSPPEFSHQPNELKPLERPPMNIVETFSQLISAPAAAAIALAIAGSITSAEAYSDPPSWDPMLMLNVTLNASNQLAVETTTSVIRLTVAPGSYNSTNKTYDLAAVSFDPSQPYAVLNGTAYSRVLGWYDQGTTGANGDDFYDTYAAQLNGHYVWIERTGGSPELQTYFINEDVTGNPGTPYTPIFGTDGSLPKWLWDGFMDHNANAVDLKCLNRSNQLFTATYHLYIGDVNGNPVAGYGDTTTTWRWQGPAIAVVPTLGIAWTNSQIAVSWVTTVTNLALVSADSLAETNWVAVTNEPAVSNGRATVILEPSFAQEYFRLKVIP
jgi:hypothetical protein